MADDATRAIALERLMQRKDEKHKRELDRLHNQIRRLKAEIAQLEAEKARHISP